jgi:Ca2+-binding EF-hand superfamily protein
MNRSITRSLTGVGFSAALALTSSLALAQNPTPAQQPMPPQSTAPVDSNKAVLDARFDAMDANHDGFLAKDEVTKDRQLAQNFATWDSNGDGKISRSEFDSHA